MVVKMKHKYHISELNSIGIDDIDLFVDEAHRRYVGNTSVDSETQEANEIYKHIIDNELVSLRSILDYVFKRSLWSTWRRGQSTFKDLLNENKYDKISAQEREIKTLKVQLETAKRDIAVYRHYLAKNGQLEAFKVIYERETFQDNENENR